jgi:hypothetical protein
MKRLVMHQIRMVPKDSFADPDHFVPDPDPTPHHSDANLRLLAYRTFTAQF